MFFSVTLCLVTYIIQSCNTFSSVEELNQYECGAHGKFEYCLNGLAGCVIGCHCHPGYYFDTETKICEPNTKLIRDGRRYMENPSRVYNNYPTSVTEALPIQTTVYDPWNNENGKENDNLGDWLYNQFFKTIETQVINKTNDDPPTRRSGSEVKHGIGRNDGDDKKAHKQIFKSKPSKKRKKKLHGLRRKLLRISEDDSLFDSDENSSDCSGHSSDSDDDNSDDSSESHGESSKEPKDSKHKDSRDDKHHDHKKVIIFNKRPRPPLPSFIFMPSMDTPYYPPIGLPPPPILPMYPMVPIPPVAPYIPYPEQNKSNNANTAASPQADNSTTSNTDPTTESTSTDEITTASESPPEETDDPKAAERSKSRSQKSRKVIPAAKSSDETFMVRSRDSESRIPWSHQRSAQLKLAQKLREKLKRRNKNPSLHQENIALNSETDEVPQENDSSVYTPIAKPKHKSKKKENFQYLSELIHKLNNTDDNPHVNGIGDDLKQFQKIKTGRRNYDPHDAILACENEIALPNNSRRLADGETYYTNLGRKIACLVRNMDSTMTENNVENSQLNANSYQPQSLWERSVRSPLKRFKNYIGRFDKYSGEKNLMSLENEVSYIASTSPPLSLLDLENILSTLQKFHSETINVKKLPDSSSASYNVDLLLHKPSKPVFDYNYFDNLLDDPVYISQVKSMMNDTRPNRWLSHDNITHFLDVPINDDWTIKYEPMVSLDTLQLPKYLESNNSFIREHEHEHPYRLYDTIDNNQFEYSKVYTPMPYLDNNDRQKLERHSEYSDIYSNIYKLPLNYRKPPIKKEKYIQMPDQQLEIYGNSNDRRSKEYQDISQLAQTNVRNEKYPEFIAKLLNTDRIEKYHSKPRKYANLLAKYPVIFAKYPDIPKKIATKFSELLKKHPDLFVKYPDLLRKYHELISTNLPAKYHDLLVQHRETPLKFPDMSPKNVDVLRKYHTNTLPEYSTPRELFAEGLPKETVYSGLIAKYAAKSPKISTKYPNLKLKYPDHARRNMHPPLYRKRKKLAVFNNNNSKHSNYFIDLETGHNHFVFEDFPLRESDDEHVIKRYESYASKPSYFHHD